MEWVKRQKADLWLLKGFCVFMLLFPAFYSPYTDVYQSAYYGGFSWAYLCLVIYIGIRFLHQGMDNRKRWVPYLVTLTVYNLLSLYFNYRYLHWYWEQINNTIAFLFFMVLVGSEAKMEEGKQDIIRFLIHCIVLSNIASIIYFLFGYTKLLICNNQFVFFELPADFYETRHYWLYSHKSEYALMLVAFTALFVRFRERFTNRVTCIASILVLLICLYLTHSWTGMAGVLLIFLGAFLDGIEFRKIRWKKQYFVVGMLLILVVGGMGYKMFSERDIMSLGARPQIWSAVLGVIRHHPEGWGMRFGESGIQATETLMVNNGHNIFLNAMLRFSVPVGGCFSILFLGIAIYSVIKSKSFLALGMWIALLILLNMDYALMSLQMGLLFLIVYLVCFYKRRERNVE